MFSTAIGIVKTLKFVITAGFRRPVVLFGAIADAANEKLASEMPDLFAIASECLFLFSSVFACQKSCIGGEQLSWYHLQLTSSLFYYVRNRA